LAVGFDADGVATEKLYVRYDAERPFRRWARRLLGPLSPW
jgi:hypothetical protein